MDTVNLCILVAGRESVIASFADRATEALFHGRASGARRFPPGIRIAAIRKLDMLNAAHELRDMRVPPGNRLEALKETARACTASA